VYMVILGEKSGKLYASEELFSEEGEMVCRLKFNPHTHTLLLDGVHDDGVHGTGDSSESHARASRLGVKHL
jgi:hypothetical protein